MYVCGVGGEKDSWTHTVWPAVLAVHVKRTHNSMHSTDASSTYVILNLCMNVCAYHCRSNHPPGGWTHHDRSTRKTPLCCCTRGYRGGGKWSIHPHLKGGGDRLQKQADPTYKEYRIRTLRTEHIIISQNVCSFSKQNEHTHTIHQLTLHQLWCIKA